MNYISVKVDIYQETHPLEGEQEITEMVYTLTDVKPQTFIFVGCLSECLEFLDHRGVDVLDAPQSLPVEYSTKFLASLN